MQRLQQHIHPIIHLRNNLKDNQSLKVLSIMTLLAVSLTGCMSTAPLHLQNHFQMKANPSESLRITSSKERVAAGMAIALLPGSYDYSLTGRDTLEQLAVMIKGDVEDTTPVSMQKVIFVENFGSQESLSRIQEFGQDNQIDTILVVVPSGVEVSGPARFDLLPEVSLLNGRQIDHHATVELGLVDTKSGQLLLQVQGNSYATLEKLDITIASNRYPRVRGSSMNSFIYPENKNALQTLRAVALDEAVQQATMKFQEKWSKS